MKLALSSGWAGWIAVLCFPAWVYSGASEAEPPQQRLQAVANIIESCQFPDGAIANTRAVRKTGGGFVTTYNFGASGLVKAYEVTNERRYLLSAMRFVDFWMDHQNTTPDRWGLVGTIYDQLENQWKPSRLFEYTQGSSKGGPGYDASDADPPIIAITAWRCYLLNRDVDALRRHRDGFELMGRAMQVTLQSDGLTWSHPNYKVKFLMDASEAYAGFAALGDIFDGLHDDQHSVEFRHEAENMRAGIVSLWNEERGYYCWARFEDGSLQGMDWSKWYPDSVEQI